MPDEDLDAQISLMLRAHAIVARFNPAPLRVKFAPGQLSPDEERILASLPAKRR